MSGDGESDDSITIRRKILLSLTMSPRDSTDHDSSPLANPIGRTRPEPFAVLPTQNVVLDSASNGTLPCGPKLVILRKVPTFLRCSYHFIVLSSNRTDIVSFQ